MLATYSGSLNAPTTLLPLTSDVYDNLGPSPSLQISLLKGLTKCPFQSLSLKILSTHALTFSA